MFVPLITKERFKQDTVLKYMYTYLPKHPLANGSGKVYEHTYVITQHLGRLLEENEVVHHRDRVRSNNDVNNLQVMTRKAHRELHLLEDGHTITKNLHCKHCKGLFTQKKIVQVFCNNICRSAYARKFEVTKAELETLVWKMPTTKVALLLGVSDTAVSKRCKSLGIKKPPRGYWAKIKAQDKESKKN